MSLILNLTNSNLIPEFEALQKNIVLKKDVIISNTHDPKEILGIMESAVNTDKLIIYLSTSKLYVDRDLHCNTNHTRYEMFPFNEKCTYTIEIPEGAMPDMEKLNMLQCDSIVREFGKSNEVNSCVLRLGCVTGFNPFISEGFIAKAVSCHLNNEVFKVQDDKVVRDQLHYLDLKAAILKIINLHTRHGECYNCGGGLCNSVSLNELINYFNSKNYSLQVENINSPISDRKCYISDTSKLFNHYGWTPFWRVSDIVNDMIISYRKLAKEIPHCELPLA